MWDARITKLKNDVADSSMLSTRQKSDLDEHLAKNLILLNNVPSTLKSDEAEVIVSCIETAINESIDTQRTTSKATNARRELLKAVHDKEEQAELLAESLYEMCQILASLGV